MSFEYPLAIRHRPKGSLHQPDWLVAKRSPSPGNFLALKQGIAIDLEFLGLLVWVLLSGRLNQRENLR